MCYIEAYKKLHQTCAKSESSGGGRQLIDRSKIYALVSLGHTLNLIDSWLQPFEENYSQQKIMYREKNSELFKKIPVTIIEPHTDDYRNKRQTLLTYI